MTSPARSLSAGTITRTSGAQRAALKLGTVLVVGLGYVGLPLALLARRKGFSVSGVDVDARKRAAIARKAVADLDAASAAELGKDALATSATFEKARDADIVVICVPTPVDHSYEPDLEPVKNACESAGKFLKRGALVILESTVNPGTAEEVLVPLIERASGMVAGVDFGFAHCPERVNPGDAAWPLEKIPRVVGATTSDARIRAAAFYRGILSAPVKEMGSVREAEAVKMTENCFRDVNIAFVNELAMSFSKLGIDVVNVLDGAATKPFGFMRHAPGAGVGGHCIPVDPYYLIRYAKKNGFSHEFLSLARSINNGMPAFAVALLDEELAKAHLALQGARIALLGLSYKPDVSDLRESPSFEIARLLEEKGASVVTYDPYARERSTAQTLHAALKDADAAVVATAHRAFAELPPQVFTASGVRILVDGRNCLAKDRYIAEGIAYRGIGR
jgi:nucleotide sugar dehydrogenase